MLQLDKNRHFFFVKDKISFSQKIPKVFFRGACYQSHRIDFLRKHFNNPLCDIGHSSKKIPTCLQDISKPYATIAEHLKYKYIASIEGNDVASNLKWILSSNSLCIMPKPKFETWFMENTLKEGVHYALLQDDFSNLNDIVKFYEKNTHKAEQIIKNANEFCAQFYNKKQEFFINVLVLRKYFYLSGQIEILDIEKELFFDN